MATPSKPAKCLTPGETSDEEVKCGLCKGYLREPKLLSCLHCFCKKCIERKAAEWIPQQIVKCPTCSKETEIPNNDLVSLPTLSYIENLDIIAHKAKKTAISCEKCVNASDKATKFCRQCGFICPRCEGIHKDFRGLENHEIVDIEKVQEDVRRYGKVTTSPQKCSTHAGKLKYYCSTCQHLVCRDCFTVGEHKDHKYENIREWTKTRFETLESSLKVLKDTCRQRITDGIGSVDDVKSNINYQVSKVSLEIDTAIAQAHEVLDERRNELKTQVEAKAQDKHDALDEQLKCLRSMNEEIDRVHRMVDSCLHSENIPDIAAAHKFMTHNMQGLIRECETIEVTPVAVANFKTKLELPDAIRNSTTVEESSADPTKCSVSTGKAEVGEKATFYVQTVYENDQPCIEAQEVRANIRSENSEKSISVTITSAGRRGEYECTFTPEERGWHNFDVLVNGQKIESSPLFVNMPPWKLKDVTHSIELKCNPYQAAFTPAGHMIVSRSEKPAKITVIDKEVQREFCNEDSHNNYLPTGIATAKDGSVYIAYDKPCIVKYDQQGQKVCETNPLLKFNDLQLKRPGRIELSKDCVHLYVCDRGNERVVVYNSSLDPVKVFAEQGQFAGIAFGEENYVYLSDKSKNIILECTSDGKLHSHFGGSVLKAPRGILMHNGHLYVSDRNNAQIVVFDVSTGDHKVVTMFGSRGDIHDCGSLTADRNGYIYVCNERGNQIQVF